MNTSSDAAESVVRLSLQGIEIAARLTGSGAKNVAAILVAISKDQHKVKGKTTLTNLLKSGKELKVFSVKQQDLKKFTKEAKKYGVLYSAIIHKKNKNPDGLIDIMVRAEDASKINRIVERFEMATVDTATIRTEIQKTKNDKVNSRGVEGKTIEAIVEEEDSTKPINKDGSTSNPNVAKTVKNHPSEPTSKNKRSLDPGTNSDKPSVREEIKKIKEEQKNRSELDDSKQNSKSKTQNKVSKHQQPKLKKKKSKERG